MEFALFYEIPVPQPSKPGDEHRAIKNVIEQAVLADQLGFHSVWTVEHHFVPDLSISSAPEVLYGAIAARTERIRIGHGVRLLPHAYNNPARVAEMAAMVDLVSDGRLEFGVGRSATRTELEGFGLNPHATRQMQQEALEQIVQMWTNDELSLDGKYWQMPKRSVVPKPFQDPHPPIWWATTSPEGHIEVGEKGLNLLSFTIGVGPDVLGERIAGYRDGLTRAKPIAPGRPGNKVGAFTMVHCAPTNEEARANAKDSFEWYVNKNGFLINEVSEWMATIDKDLGTYAYIKDLADQAKEAAASMPEDAPPVFDQLDEISAFIAGDPDKCIEKAKLYEAAGCDLLMCLVNPYDIAHEDVMQCIELVGKQVMPEFTGAGG